jgi:uncharacterized membrane protein
MPQRNEIYGWEIWQAMHTRRRQARRNIYRTLLWWLTVIAVGFCAGLVIMWGQGALR